MPQHLIAAGLAACSGLRRGPSAERISRQADPRRRAVRGRRRRRSDGAADRGRPGPSSARRDRGEPGRRQQHARRELGEQSRARRLYAAVRRLTHVWRPRGEVGALQSDGRFHARRPGRRREPKMAIMSMKKPQKSFGEVGGQAARASVPPNGPSRHPASDQPDTLPRSVSQPVQGDVPITPYRGTAPALTDVTGGHVEAFYRRHDRAVAAGAGRQGQAARHHQRKAQLARARNADRGRKRDAGLTFTRGSASGARRACRRTW